MIGLPAESVTLTIANRPTLVALTLQNPRGDQLALPTLHKLTFQLSPTFFARSGSPLGGAVLTPLSCRRFGEAYQWL